MRELEEYLARERAETLGRSLKRKLTRQERARRRACRRVALILVSSFFAGFVITVALLTWAPATQAAAPPPAVHSEPEPQEEPENEQIEAALLAKATKIEGATITHYCICETCCGKSPDHPAYGITASGRRAAPGVSVGVDPNVIPLGSDVLVDYGDGELHYYRADDTGSGVSGNHLDLCVASHQEALDLVVRVADVYWCPQEVAP